MTTTSSAAGPSGESAGALGQVELGLPARGDLLFLARMTAAAVASRAEFGYDQIEDLRLALDELCLALLQGASDDARIDLQFGWTEDSIEVTVAMEPGDEEPPSPGGSNVQRTNELSERILDALVDSHGSEERDGRALSWLRLKRDETTR